MHPVHIPEHRLGSGPGQRPLPGQEREATDHCHGSDDQDLALTGHRLRDHGDQRQNDAERSDVVAMFEHEFESENRRLQCVRDEEEQHAECIQRISTPQCDRTTEQCHQRQCREYRRYRVEQAVRDLHVVVKETHLALTRRNQHIQVVHDDAEFRQHTLPQREIANRVAVEYDAREIPEDVRNSADAAGDEQCV